MKLKLVRTVVVAPEVEGGAETKEEPSDQSALTPSEPPTLDAGLSSEIDACGGNAEESCSEQVAPQSPTGGTAENGSHLTSPTSPKGKISHEEIARRIQVLMDEKEAKKKHKAWLRTAVQVAVQDHPAYAEYCKLQNCGVDENTLRDLMERESTEERALDFKLLRNPFQLIELKPPKNLDDPDSEDDTKSVDEDGSVVSDPKGSQASKAPEPETKEEPTHHVVKTLTKEQEAAKLLAEFDERSDSSDAEIESSSEEEDSDSEEEEYKPKTDDEEPDFLNGSHVFKVERLWMYFAMMALLFDLEDLEMPPTFTFYFRDFFHPRCKVNKCEPSVDGYFMMFEKCERSECERWSELGVNIVNEWHFRGFRAMLQSLKERYGWELFNIYRFRHIMDYAILLAFCLTVNYCMLYFWIIPDYTDPRYTTIWKNTYITYFWTRGMCVTLGTALLGILACLAVAAPVFYFYGMNVDDWDGEGESELPGDGGRSYSSKNLNLRYMGTHRSGSVSNWEKGGAIMIVGSTYIMFLWTTFFVVMFVLRRSFIFKTKVNYEYTSIITIKEFVKTKIRLMLLLSTFMVVPVCWKLLTVLIPHWDWIDTYALPVRLGIQMNESHTYHTPCYFQAFPPNVDPVTTATHPILFCYTIAGVTVYSSAMILYILYAVGVILMFKSIIRETFRALEGSDFYEVFLFADRKYLLLRSEVYRFPAWKILVHQFRISAHFFGIWREKQKALGEDKAAYRRGAASYYGKKANKFFRRCFRLDKDRYDMHPVSWEEEVDARVKAVKKHRKKMARKRIRDAKNKLAAAKRKKAARKKGILAKIWAILRKPKDDDEVKIEEMETEEQMEAKLPQSPWCKKCRRRANSSSFQSIIMLMTVISILPLVPAAEAVIISIMGCEAYYDYFTPFLCSVFIAEFWIKINGWRMHFWKSNMNKLDFLLVILCFVDLLMWFVEFGTQCGRLDVSIDDAMDDAQVVDDGGGGGGMPNLSFLRALKAGKGAKMTKLLKLFKVGRFGRFLKYIGIALKQWLLLFLSDTEPTEVIIEEIMKKGVPRWRLRRALPVKFEDMKKAFGNVKHEYTVGFGEFCVDHDLVISPWEALLDTCAYSYMIAPFKHWQYGWRIWFYVEPISIIFVMRCVNRSLTPDVACLWGAFVYSIFVIYTFLRRPFLYKREEAADVTCRLLSLSQYLGGFLIYNKMVDPLLMDRIFVWSNLYMLFNFVFVWTGFIDRVIEEYKSTIAKMDAAVLDFVFAQCDVKSFAFENINVGLQLLMQWDDLVKYQRSTLLLGWTRTNPSNLLGWRERTLLVRWAAIRGMFLKTIRTENGLCILHNAMGKAESDVVRWLLHVHPSLIGVQDDQRDTPVVVALKECATTLLKLEIDPQNRSLLWKRSRYAEILMCQEVQKGKIRWNVHHFKSFNDIAVENLGELTQQLALVYNLNPPPGFQRYAMASKYKPITVAFLAECACVVRSDLELDNCELGDIGSPTFVNMMAALQLRETKAMMKTNFFLSFPIHVRRLVATRNRLAAPAGRALSSMLLHNQTVTLLDLTDNNLDSEAGIAIAEGLKKNETLRYLILARNNMGTEAGQAMASVIKRNRTLVRIDLSFNRMGPVVWWRNRFAKVEIPGAGEAIGDALRVNKHLTELDLSHNECGPTAGDSFAEALRYNHTLTRLNLSANVLTAPGAKNLAFVLGLKNGLVTLNLAQNILGSKTGMVLLRAIRTMPVLTDLDISRNEFGNTVGMSLMEAMQDNQTLISLVSQENKFGAGVTYQLGHMLEKNNTLTSLDLADNDLGIGEEVEEGAAEVSPGKALGHGIATNMQLVSLDISGNRFPASELSPIMGAMDANFTLIRLKADNQRFDDVSTLQLAGSIENTRRYLHLDLNKCDIGPRAGTVIGLALENLRKLQVINLSDNALGEKVAKKMAALLSNRKMRISTLRLSNNDFGSEGCMHIVAVIPNNKTLTDLDLSHNGLDRNVALELAENTAIKMESGIIVRPARLKRLNISHNEIGTEAGVAIIEALSTEKTGFLDMSNCDLGPECGEALARGLRSITCGWIELVLEDNKLGKDGVNPMFWAMRRNTSVLSLDLSNNQIGPVFGTDADGVGTYGTSVASFLEMNYIVRWLDLANNGISADCGALFCEAMVENPSMKCIFMEGNSLDGRAGSAVGAKLYDDTQLEYINLAGNYIGWEGGRDIGEALLENRTLTNLDLTGNGIGDRGPLVGDIFSKVLWVNIKLRVLKLAGNRLGPTSGKKIADALTRNNSLIELDLTDNRFDGEVGADYYDALSQNSVLMVLMLDIKEVGEDIHKLIVEEMVKRQPKQVMSTRE